MVQKRPMTVPSVATEYFRFQGTHVLHVTEL